MAEAKTVSVKYIFLDVVKYSQDRSVEAQTDIIAALNQLVRGSAKDVAAPEEKIIYLPTGDGICTALFDVDSPYDIHLQLALRLLERLDACNSQTADPMRKFQIRIGINANVDNLVVDINGNQNIAGAGINLAQRVMSCADGNQILVGEAVFDTLRHREKYMNSFRSFSARTKHGTNFAVHQFIQPGTGLNTSAPTQFAPNRMEKPRLTNLAAYYFAHCIKNRQVLRGVPTRGTYWRYSATILLTSLAGDSVYLSRTTEIDPPGIGPHTWKGNQATFNAQLEYYKSLDYWVVVDLSQFFQEKHLSDYYEYFEGSRSFSVHFVTAEGREKLKREWPEIWKEFGFDSENFGEG